MRSDGAAFHDQDITFDFLAEEMVLSWNTEDESNGPLGHDAASSDDEERTRWRAMHAPDLIGEAPGLLRVIDVVRMIADTSCPVLINGESGSGKELIARALHTASPRRQKNFVALNCTAVPETLIEDELFGHVKGAFTGAHVTREGRFLVANGGTLFLDEIGDMPLSLQAKLLRVLQEGVVTMLGDTTVRPVDVRIIAATHRDLETLVAEGKFRADLYYRLNVIPVRLPALRERRDDVVPLARHFLGRANQRMGRKVTGFDRAAEELVASHAWPGNVRELQNLVERVVALKGQGMVTAADVKENLRLRSPAETPPRGVPVDGALDLKQAHEELERQLIQAALARTQGNRTEAAALLGLNRTTLVEKLRKLG